MILHVQAGRRALGSVRVLVKALACHRELDVVGQPLTEGETHVDDTTVRRVVVGKACGRVSRQRILEAGGQGPTIGGCVFLPH